WAPAIVLHPPPLPDALPISATVISLFEATIEAVVALAVLMPIVASMGGNAATQTLTVAVRALATRELTASNAARIVWKETVVGRSEEHTSELQSRENLVCRL